MAPPPPPLSYQPDDMMRYIVDDEYDWLDGTLSSASALDGGIMGAMVDDPMMSTLLLQQQQHQQQQSSSYYHPSSFAAANPGAASSANPNAGTGTANEEEGDDGSTTWKQGQVPGTSSRLSQPPAVGDIFSGFDAISRGTCPLCRAVDVSYVNSVLDIGSNPDHRNP